MLNQWDLYCYQLGAIKCHLLIYKIYTEMLNQWDLLLISEI
jgi:hypothetical protein